jgi:hypothetical protein
MNSLDKFFDMENKEKIQLEHLKEHFDKENIVYGIEAIKPNHYKVTITNNNGESIQCNYFDIARGLGLSLEQFTALRYFRKKGGTEKQINDTEKAIQCLELHKKRLINSK